MGSGIEVLQGSYVYLLIFQILIVAFLLLFLVWLVIGRMRKRGLEPVLVSPQANVVAAPVVEDEQLKALMEEQKEKIDSLEAEISRLEGTTDGVKELQEKNLALKEKVKYLEQKLLEYEILQEEIGTLSYLKVENEKLRQEIMVHSDGDPVSVEETEKKEALVPEEKGEDDLAVSQEAVSAEAEDVVETTEQKAPESDLEEASKLETNDDLDLASFAEALTSETQKAEQDLSPNEPEKKDSNSQEEVDALIAELEELNNSDDDKPTG